MRIKKNKKTWNDIKNIFSVFTNVAETSDGGVFWEGMDEIPQGVDITSWLGERWTPGTFHKLLF